MGENKLQLNKELADRIGMLIGSVGNSIIEVASIAAEVRNQYLDSSGKKYDPEFEKFWTAFDMDKKFGTRATFTRYASVGDLVSRVDAQLPAFRDQLPTTLTALYEISQLDTDEIELCLIDTFRRSEVTVDRSKWQGSKTRPTPLIHPHVKHGEIAAWRKSWRNPVPPDTDKRKTPLAEIKIHKSFGTFLDGAHVCPFGLDELLAIVEDLKAAIDRIPGDYIRLDLHDQQLIERFKKNEVSTSEDHDGGLELPKKKLRNRTLSIRRKSVERLSSA